MKFEWDEGKRQADLKRHGIDFGRAMESWKRPVLEFPSLQTQHGEPRLLAIGLTDSRCITVVFTWRGDARRIVSVRRARKNEREEYEAHLGRSE